MSDKKLYQVDFVRMQRYTVGVDAYNQEEAEFRAEQLIPEIDDSDWSNGEVDFVAMEYIDPENSVEED